MADVVVDFEALERPHWSDGERANAQTVAQFVQLLMNDHAFDKVLERYSTDTYVQHNRAIPDGIDGLVGYVARLVKRFPDYSYDVRQVVPSGDRVVFHSHATLRRRDRGNQKKGFIIFDMWKVDDGRIANHWDALQPLDVTSRLIAFVGGGSDTQRQRHLLSPDGRRRRPWHARLLCPPVPYQTVLIDLDHTLLDSDASETAAYERTLRMAGVHEPAALFPTYQRINKAMWAQVEAGDMRPDDVRFRRFEAFNREVGIGADPVEMAEAFVHGLGANGDLYPGARELLEALNGRVRMALLTNGISEVQRARVARLGLERFFEAIVVSGEVGTAKPAAAIYDITFERLGAPPRAGAVMVGDSLSSDMAGGRNYGIATCWYNRHRVAPPEDVELTHVVGDLADIAEVVLG